MRWLLVELCGLALVHLSAPLIQDGHVIIQKPRFYGVKEGQYVVIYCMYPLDLALQVDWFRTLDSDQKPEKPVSPNSNVLIEGKMKGSNGHLFLKHLTPADSGIYYCKVNGTMGPGTGLQVMHRPSSISELERSSRMKDALIILQTLMLLSCIAAPLLQRYILIKKEDAIYEDPQHDHTYEGLVVETCEGALYEDISSYAQTGEPGDPWEQ